MSRALEAALDELHGLLAETLAAPLRAHRIAQEAAAAGRGDPPALLSPQFLSQVIKFLKDNGIDAPARRNPGLANLAEQLDNLDLDEVAALRPN